MHIRSSMTMVPLLAMILVSPVVQAIGEPSSAPPPPRHAQTLLYFRHPSATDNRHKNDLPPSAS